MHEGNFTERIVAAILQELKKRPGYQPKRIKVKVGEMLHLEPESVKMHYAFLTKGTPLEKAELDLSEVKVTLYCWQCNHVMEVEDHHLLLCTYCSTTDVEVMSGNEVLIDSIEMESV